MSQSHIAGDPGGAGPVDRFLDAVQHATIDTCDAWSDDVELDATVPNWRFHRRGPDAIRAEYRRWFADPGEFKELERIQVADGEVVRYLLAWTEGGIPHTAHHMHRLEVRDGLIVADRVLCGGRWPQDLMAEMASADGGP